jgi:hypothetical protein
LDGCGELRAHALVTNGFSRRRLLAIACKRRRAVVIPAGIGRLPFRRSSSKLCAILDLSRGLRVDDQDHQRSRSGSGDEHAAAAGEGVSIATYSGDGAQVREGFALALRLLGLSTPMVNGDTRAQSEDGE